MSSIKPTTTVAPTPTSNGFAPTDLGISHRRRPVWVVTGASSGLGHAIALQAVQQQSVTVVAIGRDRKGLEAAANAGCRTIELDLRAPAGDLEAAVDGILKTEGPVDVLVNAAGYILEGAIEETSDAELVDIFSTNVFAPVRLARAVLPHMRQAGRGIIVNVAGIGAFRGSPNAGLYCASKAALTTLTEALQHETDPHGIRVCLLQLGHFRTSFLQPSHRVKVAGHIPDYDPVLDPLRAAFNGLNGAQPGDPVKAATVIVELLKKSDPRDIPFLLALGSDVPAAELSTHKARREEMLKTESITSSTDF